MHRCQLYMFRTVTVRPQELLFRCCMCRIWYVVGNALSDTSSWWCNFWGSSHRFLYVPPGLTFINSTLCSLCFECFVRISEQTATFALYSINWLVFITVVESVYCALRTDSLYKADYVSSLKRLILHITPRIHLCVFHSTNQAHELPHRSHRTRFHTINTILYDKYRLYY